MALRYVILHHIGHGAPHYYLMVESTPGGLLLTWRSPEWPIRQPTNLTRIGEHRRDFLEYEGPLSDNRGQVTRIASGDCQAVWQAAHEFVLSLPEVTLTIQRLDDDHWLATPT